jgi:hypothetical protein
MVDIVHIQCVRILYEDFKHEVQHQDNILWVFLKEKKESKPTQTSILMFKVKHVNSVTNKYNRGQTINNNLRNVPC